LRRENPTIETLIRRHVRIRPQLHQIESFVRFSLPHDNLRIRNSLELLRCYEIPSLLCQSDVGVTCDCRDWSGVGKRKHSLHSC
jgi:hypothetical protein